MKYHNYYQVLGVDERAGTDEILEAFRYHARECHGMAINGDQSASRRFNELNEAFDVLDDQERRGKYDALGHHWGHLSEFTPPPLLRRGHSDRYGMLTTEHTYSLHVEGTGFSDFFENLFAFRYHTPHEGLSDFIHCGKNTCTGPLKRDVEIELLVRFDEVQYGTEKEVVVLYPPLPGKEAASHTVSLTIPKEVDEGTTVCCSGLGEPGDHGEEAGDLLFRIRLEHHPDTTIQDKNCQSSKVASWETPSGTRQAKAKNAAFGNPTPDKCMPKLSQLAGQPHIGRDVSKIRAAGGRYSAFSFHHDTSF